MTKRCFISIESLEVKVAESLRRIFSRIRHQKIKITWVIFFFRLTNSSTYYFASRVQSFKFCNFFVSFFSVSGTNTLCKFSVLFFFLVFLCPQYIEPGLMLFEWQGDIEREATEKRDTRWCLCLNECHGRNVCWERRANDTRRFVVCVLVLRNKVRECKIIDPVRPWLAWRWWYVATRHSLNEIQNGVAIFISGWDFSWTFYHQNTNKH